MHPQAPYLLAAINITEETRTRYPLGDVQDVHPEKDDRGYKVHVVTLNGDKHPDWDAALAKHPSFLRRTADDQNPELVTYVFAVPPCGKEVVKQIVDTDHA